MSGSLPLAWEDRSSSSSLTVTSPWASVPAVIALTWYNFNLKSVEVSFLMALNVASTGPLP